jgi:DNA-directed RNA polymerase subunit beta'
MRGLMAKPSGKIIETPIIANFREGLSVLEYFSSTHGARKGLADTALKTADAGYLTRKLVDVAQNVVITCHDCGTLNGITKGVVYKGDKIEVPLSQTLYGRCARDSIVDIVTDEVIVRENQLITEDIGKRIEALGYEKVRVRSSLTCDASLGVCALCYGMDLSQGELGEQGLAVGIIAAESIGEPGTQLTMRTFHIGGTAMHTVEEARIVCKGTGRARFVALKTATIKSGQVIVLNRNGEVLLLDEKEREIERHTIPAGSILKITEGQDVKARTILCQWDPHNMPILAEKSGKVRFEDVVKNETLREEVDPRSGVKSRIIMEHKGELHPQVVLEDDKGGILAVYPLPEKAHMDVEEGETVSAGTVLAKTPREISGTQDITGGLPRVTELFEARKPKDPAVISEIDGIVELGEKRKGKRTILVKNEETGMTKELLVPQGRHLRVHSGDRVRAGEALVDGPLVPHDILRISGEEAVQQYLLREVQGVYRSQKVSIDDKHVEIIVGQMMRKVRIASSGDTTLLPGTVIDKFRLRDVNLQAKKDTRKPATYKPLLLGVTKASVQSESFISAASFQETTKVLTEAAVGGKRDDLVGLKENVILGHMIPAGTGFKKYMEMRMKKEIVEPAEAAPPAPTTA